MVEQLYSGGGQNVTPDIYFLIGMNLLEGSASIIVNGFTSNVSSSQGTIWPNGGRYSFPSVPATIEVRSSTGSDNATGSGAREVEVIGLDQNWDTIVENIIMNGTSWVESINQFIRVNRVNVIDAGGNGYNNGTITVRHTSNNNTLQTIQSEVNSSTAGVWSIPDKFNGGVLQIGGLLNENINEAFFTTYVHLFDKPYKILSHDYLIKATSFNINIRSPVLIPPKSDLEMVAYTSDTGSDIILDAGIELILLSVDYSAPEDQIVGRW